MNFVAMISEIMFVQVDDSWWINSGASRHVCNNKQFFKSLKDLDDGPILYMGNDTSRINAICCGNIAAILSIRSNITRKKKRKNRN